MATSVYEEAGLSHCHAAAGRGVHGPSKYSRPLRVHSRFARLRDFVEPRGRPAALRSYRFSSVHVRAAVGWHRRCAECGGSVLHCVISPTGRLSVDDRRSGCRSPRRGAPVTLRPTCAGFGGNQARADFVSCRSLPAPCNKHTQDLVQGVSCKCGVCGDRAANRRSRRSRGGVVAPFFRIQQQRAASPARSLRLHHLSCLAARCTGRRLFQAPASTSAAQTEDSMCQWPNK